MAESTLRAKQKEKSAAKIRKAANKLFAKNGYDETTMSEIAAKSGVSRRTLFRYFGTKEELVLADVPERIARFAELLTDVKSGESVVDTVERAARTLSGELVADKADLLAAFKVAAKSETLSAAQLTHHRDLEQVLVTALTGRFKGKSGDRRARIVAATLATGMRVTYGEWLAGGAKEDLEALAEATAQSVKSLLGPAEAPKPAPAAKTTSEDEGGGLLGRLFGRK